LLRHYALIRLDFNFHCNEVATTIIVPQSTNETWGVKSVNRLNSTMKFRGIRNKLYMAALLSSGTIIPFIVPMLGKYIPTHTSNRFIDKKVDVALFE
jgi:hypothetical protein